MGHEASIQYIEDSTGQRHWVGFYDKEAETQVITDASPVGLRVVLVQKQKG